MSDTVSGKAGPVTATQPWRAWQDWIAVALGAYLALSPLWTDGANAAWFVTLGILVAGVGLWALGTSASAASEWVQIILGAVVFLSPWIGGFAAVSAAAWTAWILGAAVIALAGWSMAATKRS